MEQLKAYASIGVVVLAGIVLQILLVWADCAETPGKIAEKFAKAYYQLDPSMREHLCAKILKAAEGRVVEHYIQRIDKEAENRGFSPDSMKHILYHMETETHRINDITAEVILTADKRVSVNPVYALVAKLFMIGETDKVNERMTVVKENGRWKVCGNAFALIKS